MLEGDLKLMKMFLNFGIEMISNWNVKREFNNNKCNSNFKKILQKRLSERHNVTMSVLSVC